MDIDAYIESTKALYKIPDNHNEFKENIYNPIISLLDDLDEVELKVIECEDFISEIISINKKHYLLYNVNFHKICFLINSLVSIKAPRSLCMALGANLVARKLLTLSELPLAGMFSEIYVHLIEEARLNENLNFSKPLVNSSEFALPQIGFVLAHEISHIYLDTGKLNKKNMLINRKRIVDISLNKEFKKNFENTFITLKIISGFFKIDVNDSFLKELDYWKKIVLSSDDILEELFCDHFSSSFVMRTLVEKYDMNKNESAASMLMTSLHLQLFAFVNIIARSFTNSRTLISREILMMSLIRHQYSRTINNKEFGGLSEADLNKIVKNYEDIIFERLYAVSLFNMDDLGNWSSYLKEFSGHFPETPEHDYIINYILNQLSFNKLASLLPKITLS